MYPGKGVNGCIFNTVNSGSCSAQHSPGLSLHDVANPLTDFILVLKVVTTVALHHTSKDTAAVVLHSATIIGKSQLMPLTLRHWHGNTQEELQTEHLYVTPDLSSQNRSVRASNSHGVT